MIRGFLIKVHRILNLFHLRVTHSSRLNPISLTPLVFYTVLYCTVLHCPALYCTVLYCTVLYCTVTLNPFSRANSKIFLKFSCGRVWVAVTGSG